jgi:hypothetical protein
VRITFGFVFMLVPGATPKKPASGLIAHRRPSGTDVQPRDVVADRKDLVALLARGRDEHRQVRLAAGARECGRDVRRAAARLLDADDQHVLGEPALAAGHVARDAEGEALLAEERVAAVAGADRPDEPLLREVHDEAALGVEVAERVQALHVVVGGAQPVERRLSHARHDPHVDDDVGAVGDLHADLAVGRGDRPHDVRHHVHGAVLHGALEQRADLLLRVGGRHPVVVGAGVFLLAGAHEGEVLGARDVGRIAAVQVAAGIALVVELRERARREHLLDQARVLGLGAVAPDDVLRAGEAGGFFDPLLHGGRHSRRIISRGRARPQGKLC